MLSRKDGKPKPSEGGDPISDSAKQPEGRDKRVHQPLSSRQAGRMTRARGLSLRGLEFRWPFSMLAAAEWNAMGGCSTSAT
jgi:hypothetical protein